MFGKVIAAVWKFAGIKADRPPCGPSIEEIEEALHAIHEKEVFCVLAQELMLELYAFISSARERLPDRNYLEALEMFIEAVANIRRQIESAQDKTDLHRISPLVSNLSLAWARLTRFVTDDEPGRQGKIRTLQDLRMSTDWIHAEINEIVRNLIEHVSRSASEDTVYDQIEMERRIRSLSARVDNLVVAGRSLAEAEVEFNTKEAKWAAMKHEIATIQPERVSALPAEENPDSFIASARVLMESARYEGDCKRALAMTMALRPLAEAADKAMEKVAQTLEPAINKF